MQYARLNGFFNGTTETSFDPNGPMTRGMFVTVLGRMAGVDPDAYRGEASFADVPGGKYYAPYVAWAARYGITAGTTETTFSPNALISRQQMAVLFVRYFEAFHVDYETGANVATVPSDLGSVAPYARDAVLKLWKQGLMNGNSGRFDPAGNASRAQAATVCKRADEAVTIWYTAPDVPSKRVSVDLTGQPVQKGEAEKSSHKGGGGGSSSATYYAVQFALGAGINAAGVTLPTAGRYRAGTPIGALPTPVKNGAMFGGWYYDSAMTRPVDDGDTVGRDLTLYAYLRELSGGSLTANFAARTVPQGEQFLFRVRSSNNPEQDKSILTLTCATRGNLPADYTAAAVPGEEDLWEITPELDAGQTYQAVLTDGDALLVLDGGAVECEASVRQLNITTEKAKVVNYRLDEDLKFIGADDVAGLNSDAFGGLFSTNANTQTTSAGAASGTFFYDPGTSARDAGELPELAEGDTVAIYEDYHPLDRTLGTESDRGDIAYLKITSVSDGSYTYTSARMRDVLFTPIVLPFQRGDVTLQGTADGCTVTIPMSLLTPALAAEGETDLDKGDYIELYTTAVDEANASYYQITGFAETADKTAMEIACSEVSEAEMVYAMEHAVEVNYEEPVENQINEDEVKTQLLEQFNAQMTRSSYIQNFSKFLAAISLEQEDFTTGDLVMGTPNTLAASINGLTVSSPGADLDGDGVYDLEVSGEKTWVDASGAAKHVKVTVKPETPIISFHPYTKMTHLKGQGAYAAITVSFKVTIEHLDSGLKSNLTVTAKFEQEAAISLSVSTSQVPIGVHKFDYAVNTSFDTGSYSGIDFRIALTSDGGSSPSLDREFVKQLEDGLKFIKDQRGNHTSGSTNGNMEGLAKLYAKLMEGAEDNWQELFELVIFRVSGSAFLHILRWQVKASFVISLNMSVYLGIHFDHIEQKRYLYSLQLKSQKTTNKTIDIIEPQTDFDFYIIGTLGIRGGLRIEVYLGLFSLKLDKIGIKAEGGVYMQLWGYFLFHCDQKQSGKYTQFTAGALLAELGAYLEIHFVAQAFSSDKLIWEPTLYSEHWPLVSAGDAQNIYAFAYADKKDGAGNVKPLQFDQAVTTLQLPVEAAYVKYMDMRSGELKTRELTQGERNPDNTDRLVGVTFSDASCGTFTYDCTANTVHVEAPGQAAASVVMTLRLEKRHLAFESEAVEVKIPIYWKNPTATLVNFDSDGGSHVESVYLTDSGLLSRPETPEKRSYSFLEWKVNGTKIDFSRNDVFDQLEAAGALKTITVNGQTIQTATVKAVWNFEGAKYRVNRYVQTPDLCGFVLADSLVFDYTDGDRPNPANIGAKLAAYPTFEVRGKVEQVSGFTCEIPATVYPADDWSTVVDLYYSRKANPVTFKLGGINGRKDITETYYYGQVIQLPHDLTRPDHVLEGWLDGSNLLGTDTVDMGDHPVTLTPKWVQTYPITFDANGSTFADGAAKYIAYFPGGKPLAGLPGAEDLTAPEGHRFDGWYDGETHYYDGALMPTHAVTVRAKWEAARSIAFDANGGAFADGSAVITRTCFVGESVFMDSEINAVSNAGYTFRGWYDADGKQYVSGSTLVPAGSGTLTLHAEWRGMAYLNPNGGAFADDTTHNKIVFFTPDELIASQAGETLPSDLTRSGYTFGGWYTGDSERAEDVIMPRSSIELRAKWIEASS